MSPPTCANPKTATAIRPAGSWSRVSTLTNPTFQSITEFNYTGLPPQNCATTQVDDTFQLNYISTGSGTGIKGWFAHDAADFWGDAAAWRQPGQPLSVRRLRQRRDSDAAAEPVRRAGDVAAYSNTTSTCITSPTTGYSYATPKGGCNYAAPGPLYGAMIQVPLLITPVDIAYDATYKRVRNADGSVTSYHFHLAKKRIDGSGGLVLDAATYCAIFEGQITDWNQIPTSLNGGQSLQDPADTGTFSVPLVMVGRSDSSGTSSVFTRHLSAVCTGAGTQYFPDFTSSISSGPSAPIYTGSWNGAVNYGTGDNITDVPGKYTGANGSSGVAAYIRFDPNNQPGGNPGDSVVQGRIGYIGPDYVLPYVTETGRQHLWPQHCQPDRSARYRPDLADAGHGHRVVLQAHRAAQGRRGLGRADQLGSVAAWHRAAGRPYRQPDQPQGLSDPRHKQPLVLHLLRRRHGDRELGQVPQVVRNQQDGHRPEEGPARRRRFRPHAARLADRDPQHLHRSQCGDGEVQPQYSAGGQRPGQRHRIAVPRDLARRVTTAATPHLELTPGAPAQAGAPFLAWRQGNNPLEIARPMLSKCRAAKSVISSA